MMALQEPHYEVANHFQIYQVILEEKLPRLTEEQLALYDPSLIQLQRDCIRKDPLARPSIPDIIATLKQFL